MDASRRRSRLSTFAFLSGGVLLVAGCFVPWRTVYSCFTTIDQCSLAPRSANWTIWQVGGAFGNNAQGIPNFWNPSTFTWWGVVVFACGVTLMTVDVVTLFADWTNGTARMLTVALASSASIIAAVVSVLVPAPNVSAAYSHVFGWGIWTTRGPGAWICLSGAVVGLIGGLVAMRSERTTDTDRLQKIASE